MVKQTARLEVRTSLCGWQSCPSVGKATIVVRCADSLFSIGGQGAADKSYNLTYKPKAGGLCALPLMRSPLASVEELWESHIRLSISQESAIAKRELPVQRIRTENQVRKRDKYVCGGGGSLLRTFSVSIPVYSRGALVHVPALK